MIVYSKNLINYNCENGELIGNGIMKKGDRFAACSFTTSELIFHLAL
jgi:hypothetical protein